MISEPGPSLGKKGSNWGNLAFFPAEADASALVMSPTHLVSTRGHLLLPLETG